MSLLNLAFVMKTQMVNKGGPVFQSAAKHEGKPAPLLTNLFFFMDDDDDAFAPVQALHFLDGHVEGHPVDFCSPAGLDISVGRLHVRIPVQFEAQSEVF